jgi:uncharacterized repeat protein (TIGR01451 family)
MAALARRLLLLALLGWAGRAAGDADLSVAIVDTPDPVAAGGALLYSLTVANAGPGTAAGVQLVNVLPQAVSFVSATVLTDAIFADGFESGGVSAWGAAAGSPCSVAGRIVTCGLGSLSAGESVLVRIDVTVGGDAAGILTDSAAVGGTTNDPVPANDSASASTTVFAPSADLSLSIGDSPDPVSIGQVLTYSLRVTNLGPAAAPDVELQDALPPEVSFVSSSGNCSVDARLVTCDLGTIAPGANVVTTLRVLVGPDAAFEITNAATAQSSAVDGNPGNNLDTEVTTVN